MEAQRMLDALTDHLAIYHRSSAVNTESRARQTVVEWMAGLNYEQRRAALTVVDTSWIAILLMMQDYLRAEGPCTFFLLPDVPVTDRESASAGTKATRNRKGKLDDNKSHGKGTRPTKPVGSEGIQGPQCPGGKKADKDNRKCTLPLPGLCFRRARGLVRRLQIQQTSGNVLIDSIRLFSSGDGENKARICSLDADYTVDCITVTEDFISDVGKFLEVMDDLSHHEFLKSPCLSAASPWEEMPWLEAMGYYSLPAFIANKFEFGLWSAWSRAQGTKKPPRSLALKTKDTQNGSIARSCSCYLHGNAAVAASVHGRKQGCMDWWSKLGSTERANVRTCTMALATKSEVLKVVGEARAARGRISNSKSRGRRKTISRDPPNARVSTACTTSLSDSEVEQLARLGTENEKGGRVAPYLAGLQALKELSESGFLCGKLEGTNSVQEGDASWLFDSTLKSVHTLSDRVRRKVRNAIVKVRNDLVEHELLGDDSSGKAHRGNESEIREVKGSKTKKKRRKNSAKPKGEVFKEEEKTCSSKPELPKEERKQQEHTESNPIEAEVQTWSSGTDEVVSEAKYISDGNQHFVRKGKGGKSKGKRDEKLQQPTLVFNTSAIHNEDLVGCIRDNGKDPLSSFDSPSISGNDPLYSSPSSNGQVEFPGRLIGQDSIENAPSSSLILDLGQGNVGKLQEVPVPVLDSVNCKTLNNGTDDIPSDDVVAMMGTDTGSFTSALDSCQNLSTKCATVTFFQGESIKIQDGPVSTSNLSDSRNKLEDRDCDQIKSDAPAPLLKVGNLPSVEKRVSASDSHKGTLEPSLICFGTVDLALPVLQNPFSVSFPAKPSVMDVSPRSCTNANFENKLDQVEQDKFKDRSLAAGQQGWEECGFEVSPSNVKPVPPPPRNGMSRLTKTSRQLDYSNNRHSHYQQGPAFRSGPHEWPGSPQFGYFGAYHQPTATDWLQLDVGRGWPQRMDPSLLTYRSAPGLRPQSGQAESLTSRKIATRTSSVGNIDRPPLVQPCYNLSPAVGYSISTKEEPRLNLRPLFNPSPFSGGYGDVEANGQGRNLDDLENDDRLAYETDGDDYGAFKSGELDDLDGYMISEEEGERYLEDAAENGSADYHQIFGGGVMYWNAADYAGLGYSRPGSLSSDDSSWARHEADLSVVLDDIVNYQPLQGPYPGKGSTSSNVPSCSPSPPSASSIPITFEHLSPVGSSNPRHCLPRPSTKEFSGKFVQLSNQGLTAEDQQVGARVPITLEVIEQIRADSSAQPILRPIVVVRDLNLSRQLSSGEALRLQEAKSPHIVPRSRRDMLGHRKRPPSPVLRCVPPAPPPPPPSPVSGPRRRKGLMAARSGSSSPRHWGLVNWPYKDESEGAEGKAKGESIPTSGRRRGNMTITPPMHPLSGALLRERLVAIPPLSVEQEHPDVSIPMKTTLLHNSNTALHLGLAKLLGGLHVEIEAFSCQVETENKMRKPFINVAVKKVAHALQVLWPRSRISIFGSIATGLSLPTSDIDLVVSLPPVRNLEPIKEAGILEGRNGIKETSLQHAARYLADQDWVKNDTMKTIENTPVPIIMMVAEFLPHQCEMGDEDTPYFFGPNIRKETCEEAAKVENGMPALLLDAAGCKEDKNQVMEDEKGPWGGKAARQLVHLDISFETPSHTGLRTAELVRELVGQYPALSPLALVLKQFLTDRSLDHPYTGGLSSYCLVLLITRFLQHQHHLGKPLSNQNLGRLFMDFLHFFGCVFDPRRMGVRIRGGGMYVTRDRYHDIDPLYIEDPLHPDNNVGRNCFRILQCVKAFADGYAVLEKKLHDISSGPEDLGKTFSSMDIPMTTNVAALRMILRIRRQLIWGTNVDSSVRLRSDLKQALWPHQILPWVPSNCTAWKRAQGLTGMQDLMVIHH